MLCPSCGHSFTKINPNQRMCGTIGTRTGCAWKNRVLKQREYVRKNQTKNRMFLANLPEPSPELNIAKSNSFWFIK